LRAAQPVDGGTLLLAVGDSGFQLFDTESGRLVATDRKAPGSPVVGVATRRAGEDLFVYLEKEPDLGSTAGAVIRVPVAVEALRRQLCAVHRVEGC
jgi:hypothetical protein